MAKGRRSWGVTRTIAPKRPSRAEKARQRLSLPVIPRALKAGGLPGPQKSS